MSDTASWAEKSNVSARDLLGIAPNFTAGMDTHRYLTHERGECPPETPCALCLVDAAEERARTAEAEVERLREGLTVVMGEHARQKWHPDTVYPTEASKNWHAGYISCAAHLSIEVRKYVDPEGAAEDAETWRIGNQGTDTEWWERTGHCGHCGLIASSCDCNGECGCWEKHGPPLEPWKSLPERLDSARANLRAMAARCWMLRQVARESDARVRFYQHADTAWRDDRDAARADLATAQATLAAVRAEEARLRRGLENMATEHGDEPGSEAYARAVLDGCET